jgi:hypothetical protein
MTTMSRCEVNRGEDEELVAVPTALTSNPSAIDRLWHRWSRTRQAQFGDAGRLKQATPGGGIAVLADGRASQPT